MSYHLNRLDFDTIQVYGKIKGFAFLKYSSDSGKKVWRFNIKGFDSQKRLHKISNPSDSTIWNKERLKERLDEIVASLS